MRRLGSSWMGVCLVAVFVAAARAELVECIDHAPLTYSDSEVLDHVQKCLAMPSKFEISYRTMETLLRNGFLKSADFLLKNYFLKQSVDISGKMKVTVVEIKNRLEHLLKMISQVKKALVTLPVFMWGQSHDSIVVHVKFSHRFDTPGCLDISEEEFEVKGRKLYYRAHCMQTHQPINFVIDINLFEEALDEGKVIRKGSVGTRVLEFKKKERKIWKNIHDDTEKFTRMQLRVWWELRDVYPDAMDEYSRLLEEDEEEDDDLWSKKKAPKDTDADAEAPADPSAQPGADAAEADAASGTEAPATPSAAEDQQEPVETEL